MQTKNTLFQDTTKIKTTLIAINKPRGIICTHNDEYNRRKVFDLIPKKSLKIIDGKLHSIGRLDYNSQGLLLLTNNTKIKLPEIPGTTKAEIAMNPDINI